MAKTNSSFKMPKQIKELLSSRYVMGNRSTVKRLFIDALSSYENSKNRKFSDPATSSQKGRPNNSTNTEES